MPTPDETLPTSPIATSSTHPSFASCPPEEEREQHAPREARVDTPRLPLSPDGATPQEHAIRQQPTPEPDAQPGLLQEQSMQDDVQKSEHIEDVAARSGESPSPISSPETSSDGDGRTAQPVTRPMTIAASDNETMPRYLHYPPLSRDRSHPHSTTTFLRPGAKFKGTQQSDRQVYDVQVEIKDVDLEESFLCGYLRIQGLTDDHPTLTTFFEGEIIGPKYLFRTMHPSWNSSEKIDLQHWARFPAFRPLAKMAKANSSFSLKNHLDRESLFMRWKEYFLVPDHRVKSISGASFEGFYYISFNQATGKVSGIYFHAKSEKYQQLELHHIPDGGCMGAVEFR